MKRASLLAFGMILGLTFMEFGTGAGPAAAQTAQDQTAGRKTIMNALARETNEFKAF